MSHHTLVLIEPHPTKPPAYQLYYITVDVYMSGTDWHWTTVDSNSGKYVGNPSRPYATEDQALDDALRTLGGDHWE